MKPISSANNEVMPGSAGFQSQDILLNDGEAAKARAPRAVQSATMIHPAYQREKNPDVTRVLLVDSEALIRCGIRAILEVEPDLDIVGEAENCREAARHAQRLGADVVLLHAQGQITSFIEAIRELVGQSNRPPVRVLILKSACGEPIDQGEILRAGASGLVLKDSGPQELAAAVRVVAAGYELLAPPKTPGIVEEVVAGRFLLSERLNELQELTPREHQVFHLIARGYSNAEIGKDLTLSDSTVKSHVKHLLTKLNLRNRMHAVIYAYECGLIRPGAGLAIQGSSMPQQ
jgi:DNA-binding NarL/FixJ family response regulator